MSSHFYTAVIPFRDRIGYLKTLLHWLGNDGSFCKKILVLDMKSTLPKAVKYLEKMKSHGKVGFDNVPVRVAFLANTGSRGMFKKGTPANAILREHVKAGERFVISDPDVIPEITSKKKFMVSALHTTMDDMPHIAKVGCSLRIDDIPDEYPRKAEVVAWESRHWKKIHTRHPFDVYSADVATTFCLVRSIESLNDIGDGKAVRIGPPGTAKHLPWYELPDNLPYDVQHYYKNSPVRRWGDPSPGVTWTPLQEPNK